MKNKDSNKNLTDLTCLMDVFRKQSINDVLSEFNTNDMKDNKLLQAFNNFFISRFHLFKRNTENNDRLLFQLAYEQAKGSPITKQAEQLLKNNRINWKWLKQANRKSEYELTPNILTLESPERDIIQVSVLSNEKLLSFSKNQSGIRLWNLKDASSTFIKLPIIKGSKFKIRKLIVLDNRKVISFSSSAVHFFDTKKKKGNYLSTPLEFGKIIRLNENIVITYAGNSFAVWDLINGNYKILKPDLKNDVIEESNYAKKALSIKQKHELKDSNKWVKWSREITFNDTDKLNEANIKVLIPISNNEIITVDSANRVRLWNLEKECYELFSTYKKFNPADGRTFKQLDREGQFLQKGRSNLSISEKMYDGEFNDLYSFMVPTTSEPDSNVIFMNGKLCYFSTQTYCNFIIKDLSKNNCTFSERNKYFDLTDELALVKGEKVRCLENIFEFDQQLPVFILKKLGKNKVLTIINSFDFSNFNKRDDETHPEISKDFYFLVWDINKEKYKRIGFSSKPPHREACEFYEYEFLPQRKKSKYQDDDFFSPGVYMVNESRFLFCTGQNLCFFNLKTTTEKWFITEEAPEINNVQLLTDNKVIFSSFDKLYVWDFIKDTKKIFKGHSENILKVSIVNSNEILTLSEDKTLILWNLRDGKIKCLKGHLSSMESSDINLISRNKVVSFDFDTLRVWDLDLNKYHSNNELQKKIITNVFLLLNDNTFVYKDKKSNMLRVFDSKNDLYRDIKHFPILDKIWKIDDSYILILARQDTALKMLNIKSDDETVLVSHKESIIGAELLNDNKSILSWSEDGIIKLTKIYNKESQVVYLFDDLDYVKKLSETNYIGISKNGSYKLLELENPSKIE